MNFYKKKIRLFLITFLGVLSLVLISFIFASEATKMEQDILLNEVCSNNFSVGKSEKENYCDYVELYNPTEQDISLDDYFLSDNKEELCKYSLQGMSISPKGYLVVWLNEVTEEEAGFGISNQGESLYLVKGMKEEIVDYVYVPKLAYDTCYARVEDGSAQWPMASSSSSSIVLSPSVADKTATP